MFTWAIIDHARDRHTAPGIARRSRLASGNCETQPWGPAAKCEFISARALSTSTPKSAATNSTNFFRVIREIRGEFLRRFSPGVPRKTGGFPYHRIYGGRVKATKASL